MKRCLKKLGTVLLGIVMLVLLTVLFPFAWLISRVAGIVYSIFHFFEFCTRIFYKSLIEGYKLVRAKQKFATQLDRVIGQVGRQGDGRPS